MRQVNGWGFKRIVSGNDHNSYYHELFVRENPQLCLKMKRIKKNEMLPSGRAGGKKEENTLMELPPPPPSLQLAQQQAGMNSNLASNIAQGTATSDGTAQPSAAATIPLVNMAGANSIPNLMGGVWNPLAALTQGAAAGTFPNALSAALGASMPPVPAPMAPPASSAQPSLAPTPGLDAGAALAGLGQLDSNMLARLQEALSSGGAASLLQGQALLGQHGLNNGASAQANTTIGNNAAAQLLAAQLQAASEPVNPAAGTAPSAEIKESSTNANNEIIDQQPQNQPPSKAVKTEDDEDDEDNEDDNVGDEEDNDDEDSNDDDDSNDDSQDE